MNILSIDTSSGTSSICLFSNNKLIFNVQDPELNMQAERIIGMIEKEFDKHKLNYNNLNNIAITIGPGSFTGIRIGVAAALGIKFGTNSNLISITSFESMLYGYINTICDTKTTVVHNLKSLCIISTSSYNANLFYIQEFLGYNSIKIPYIISIDELQTKVEDNSFTLITNKHINFEEPYKKLNYHIILPSALYACGMGIFKIQNNLNRKNDNIENQILYIQNPI